MNKKAKDLLELRDLLASIQRAEDRHVKIGKADLAAGHLEAINTTRDEADHLYAQFLRDWPVRRINAVLNAAAETLDQGLAVDRQTEARMRKYAPHLLKGKRRT